MPALPAKYKPSIGSELDGRTKEARLLAVTRRDLTAHVGGTPSATQHALIERAVMMTLHLAQLDKRIAEGGTLTERESTTYTSLNSALSRTLARLGTQPATKAPKSLAEHMAERQAERT